MDRIDDFKDTLATFDPKQVVRRYILSGTSFALTEEKEFELKDRTADCFDVEYSEDIVVGLGSLVSLLPQKNDIANSMMSPMLM